VTELALERDGYRDSQSPAPAWDAPAPSANPVPCNQLHCPDGRKGRRRTGKAQASQPASLASFEKLAKSRVERWQTP